MKTIKTLIKEELVRLNYPVKVEEEYKNRRIKNMTNVFVRQDGIKVIRKTGKYRVYNKQYKDFNERKYEEIEVHIYNYITKKEMKKIVDRLLKNYYNPYIDNTNVSIF